MSSPLFQITAVNNWKQLKKALRWNIFISLPHLRTFAGKKVAVKQQECGKPPCTHVRAALLNLAVFISLLSGGSICCHCFLSALFLPLFYYTVLAFKCFSSSPQLFISYTFIDISDCFCSPLSYRMTVTRGVCA